MSLLETRTIEQLAPAVAVTANACVVTQEPGGPMLRAPLSLVLAVPPPGVVQWTANRAGLAATPAPATGKRVSVNTEPFDWEWQLGNFTAQVAADPAALAHQPHASIAVTTGCWVLIFGAASTTAAGILRLNTMGDRPRVEHRWRWFVGGPRRPRRRDRQHGRGPVHRDAGPRRLRCAHCR